VLFRNSPEDVGLPPLRERDTATAAATAADADGDADIETARGTEGASDAPPEQDDEPTGLPGDEESQALRPAIARAPRSLAANLRATLTNRRILIVAAAFFFLDVNRCARARERERERRVVYPPLAGQPD
jgi:hypothetical protein